MANSGLVLSAHPAVSAELLEIRAEARSRRGQIPEAREDLHAALAAKQNGPDRSLVLSRLALLISGAEDYSRASELADLALTEAGSDLPARARALAVAAMVEGNLGNLERSGLLAEQALDLFRKLENAHGTADILELKGLNLLYAGRITDAVDVLGRVATLFRDSGKLLRIGPAVSMRCLGLRAMARAAQGLGEIEEVLELQLQLGNLEGESWCRSTRALLLAEVGRSAEAEAEGRTALELARRLGHRELVSAALLSLGAVLEKAQRLDEALTMLEECAAEAAGLPAFRCFAASGMALIEVEQGKLASAEVHLQQARDAGFPFALYQADVAHAKLLIARKEPGAQQAIAGYLKSAESGGDRLTVERLRQLLAGARPITVR